jgi:ferritin-like metal-binding protein YciE
MGDTDIKEQPAKSSAGTRDAVRQERLARECLDALGASFIGSDEPMDMLHGESFAATARLHPDITGKLLMHAYGFEHLEIATYELLEIVAEEEGNASAAEASRGICAQERETARRLSGLYDEAVDTLCSELKETDLSNQLNSSLSDAREIGGRTMAVLKRGSEMSGDNELTEAFESHYCETQRHEQLLSARLESRHPGATALEGVVMQIGPLSWDEISQARPETPAKLAALTYAFTHLVIAAYELVSRIAQRAGDDETVSVLEEMLTEERVSAKRMNSLFPLALNASVHKQGAAELSAA